MFVFESKGGMICLPCVARQQGPLSKCDFRGRVRAEAGAVPLTMIGGFKIVCQEALQLGQGTQLPALSCLSFRY